tara:strand:+ start:1462 stop:1938 length:477 start_codon:yes stop_codon:yes gene_type:complete
MAAARARRNKLNEAFYAAKDELEKAKKKVDAAEMSIAVAENELKQTKQALQSLSKTKNDQKESVRKTCVVPCRDKKGKEKTKCMKRPPCKLAKERRKAAETNRKAKSDQKEKQIENLQKLRRNKKQLLETVKEKEAALKKAKIKRDKGAVDFISDLKF